MSKTEKTLDRVLRGLSDQHIDFDDICFLLDRLGFSARIKGSHRIYFKEGIDEIINLQPLGRMAKPYQVKQIRNIILKYRLGNIDE
jgi:predicted RNA binding protein YcfA (HicA-like mRNA interferase family)